MSERTAISRNSIPDFRDGSELSIGHESNRLANVHEYGSEPPLFSGLNNMDQLNQSPEVKSESIEEQNIDNQIAYKFRSKAFSLGRDLNMIVI